MDDLTELLDELGDAHEAYATSVGVSEAQAMEDRCHAARDKIRAMISAPPSAPPADVTRALANYFKAIVMQGDPALLLRTALGAGRSCGLVLENGCASDLGRAALALAAADPQPLADQPKDQ